MPEAIRIAGAGLAGLTAAVVLGEAGRRVTVYETKRQVTPSSGPHTEGIRNYRTVDALEELRSVGLDLRPFSTIQHTFRVSPHHRNELVGSAHYLFLRGREPETVDQVLVRRAESAGVHFRFGMAARPEEVQIMATGPPREATRILGAGYAISAKGSSLTSDTAFALFDNRIAPGGYLAITPGKSYHSIYSVSWTELDYTRLLSRVEKAFEIPWVRELLDSTQRVGRIHGRAFYLEDPIAQAERDGVLYAGEAGGFQDAVAGFGFRYAVETGALAARSILQDLDYRGLLRETFGSEFKDAFALRQQLNCATNEDYDAMVAALGARITLAEYRRRRGPRGF